MFFFHCIARVNTNQREKNDAKMRAKISVFATAEKRCIAIVVLHTGKKTSLPHAFSTFDMPPPNQPALLLGGGPALTAGAGAAAATGVGTTGAGATGLAGAGAAGLAGAEPGAGAAAGAPPPPVNFCQKLGVGAAAGAGFLNQPNTVFLKVEDRMMASAKKTPVKAGRAG